MEDNEDFLIKNDFLLPKFIKDKEDGWVGKLNEDYEYESEDRMTSIDIGGAIVRLIEGDYVVATQQDYKNYNTKQKISEIDNKIQNNICQIQELQEENESLYYIKDSLEVSLKER